ncbi:hypothetical protein [Streptomyces sp. NPDC059460]|uniref:hypothetical protein n=1 Tax=Streptomyces sp. NPDC059460 TaxID=3346840 RepID=UPI003698478E
MTARAGEPFALDRAVSEVEALLAGPVPAAGTTRSEGEPVAGEWRVTAGEGFRFLPPRESDP